jgi:hypothetical protein
MLIFLLVLLIAGLGGFGYWAYTQGYLKSILKFVGDNSTRISQGPLDMTPPVITGVEVSATAVKEVGILWKTDDLSSSQVEWGPSISYGNKTEITDDPTSGKSAGLVTHGTKVSNLTGNTTYHYRVISKNKDGFESKSGDDTFTTSAE